MQIALGDIFAFLDADDFWSENHLEEGLKNVYTRGTIFCHSGVFIL